MADNETQQPEEQQEPDYIGALAELKANSVSKDQYAKVQEDNARLLAAIINGDELEDIERPEAPDVDALRKELFGGEAQLSNLEYATKALSLRSELIARGERDPFLPYGAKITPTPEDEAAAERVAEALQACIDYSDGDSLIFTNEIQRIMKDTAPPKKPAKKII